MIQKNDSQGPFPASRKVLRGELEVPVREIELSGGEPVFEVYDTTGPQGYSPSEGLPKRRAPWLEGMGVYPSAIACRKHFALGVA